MNRAAPKRRLPRLVVALAACLGLAGVVQPWKPRGRPHAAAAVEPSGDEPAAVDVASAPREAADVDFMTLVSTTLGAKAAPTSSVVPAKDPFFLPAELAAGRTLDALRHEAAAEQARREEAATEPRATSRPAVDPAEIERLRSLRLLGVVGSADGATAVAVLAGVGRVRVGERLPGSSFTLHAATTTGVELRADDVRVAIPLRRPKGGVSPSENP